MKSFFDEHRINTVTVSGTVSVEEIAFVNRTFKLNFKDDTADLNSPKKTKNSFKIKFFSFYNL